MKIVAIFEGRLYAVHYDEAVLNELGRVLEQWNDVAYLSDFFAAQEADWPPGKDLVVLVEQALNDVERLEQKIQRLFDDPRYSLDQFFAPLVNSETVPILLSFRKRRANCLRLYALRVEESCFVITGGTIKLTHLMAERPHTQYELAKLQKVRD